MSAVCIVDDDSPAFCATMERVLTEGAELAEVREDIGGRSIWVGVAREHAPRDPSGARIYGSRVLTLLGWCPWCSARLARPPPGTTPAPQHTEGDPAP